MSITMVLELEDGISLSEVSLAMEEVGAEFSVENECIKGNFLRSNCYFLFRFNNFTEAVSAEGGGMKWEVSAEVFFNSAIDCLDRTWMDIKDFLVSLSKLGSARFVLSFQYEVIYAYRERERVVFLKEMIG